MLIYCRISINIKEMEYLFHPIKQMVGNIMHGYHIWSGSLPNVSNMATPRIIDAWTTLPKLRTWEVQVNHNGIITWKRFRITSHLWGESTGHQWATRQRDSYVLRDPWKSYLPIEMYVIWDTTTFISRYCNDAWAVLMWSILWLDSYTKLYDISSW